MTPEVPWVYVIALLLLGYVFWELWKSTRNEGLPSASFWVLCVVVGAILLVVVL